MSTPSSKAIRRSVPPTAKFEALSYQSDAVHALETLEYGAVFHEQGLGKTKIAIDLALSWLTSGSVDSVFIVTKRSLIPNWRREVARHTNLAARVLSQNRRDNYFAFNSRSRLFLLHYEVFKYELDRIKLFTEARRVGIILDESQKIKNPDASLTSDVLSVSPSFAKRFIMSGTPIANRPYDIWSQVFFLDHGNSLGTDFKNFKRDFDFNDLLATIPEERERFANNLEWLRIQLQPFSVRETKASAGIDLPTKHLERITCAMAPQQELMYSGVRDELKLEVEREGRRLTDSSEDILKRLLRLVQVASFPGLVDESYTEVPAKLTLLRALLNSVIFDGQKAIVWTTFVGTAEWLARELREFGCRRVHGQMTIDERESSIKSFLENPSTQVLVATTGAAKEGLTLTVANHAIFFDRSFSLDDFLQAQDRIHRISQSRECFVYVLMAERTIDEWVDLLIDAKRFAAQFSQGDISRDEYDAAAKYDFYSVLKNVLSGKGDE